MPVAHLSDRGLLHVSGEDAATFLQGLITNDIRKVAGETAIHAALLTPQGKVLYEFIVRAAPEGMSAGYLIDVSRPLALELARRLAFYKLRAKVEIFDLSDELAVLGIWGGPAPAIDPFVLDPRLPALGWRVVVGSDFLDEAMEAAGEPVVPLADWEAHRIRSGVPEMGRDYITGEVFPHEIDMDQLGGLDFKKGCYVGQEVVSRMEHRGTARTRMVQVKAESFCPEAGVVVMAGEKTLGTMGSSEGPDGIAMLRLDRLADAQAEGTPIIGGGVPIEIIIPAWANFGKDSA